MINTIDKINIISANIADSSVVYQNPMKDRHPHLKQRFQQGRHPKGDRRSEAQARIWRLQAKWSQQTRP